MFWVKCTTVVAVTVAVESLNIFCFQGYDIEIDMEPAV